MEDLKTWRVGHDKIALCIRKDLTRQVIVRSADQQSAISNQQLSTDSPPEMLINHPSIPRSWFFGFITAAITTVKPALFPAALTGQTFIRHRKVLSRGTIVRCVCYTTS
jgi:hypothetical protein